MNFYLQSAFFTRLVDPPFMRCTSWLIFLPINRTYICMQLIVSQAQLSSLKQTNSAYLNHTLYLYRHPRTEILAFLGEFRSLPEASVYQMCHEGAFNIALTHTHAPTRAHK